MGRFVRTFTIAVSFSMLVPRASKAGNVSPLPLSLRGGIHGAVALPLGGYAQDSIAGPFSTSRAGFADLGFSAGGQLALCFGSSGLGWALDATLIMNPFDIEGFDAAFRANGLSRLSIIVPREQSLTIDARRWWINVPVLTGPRFDVQIAGALNVYATALAGVSLLMAPDVTVTGPTGQTVEHEHELTPALGLAIESGFLVGPVSIGTRFSFLGSSEVTSTERISWNQAPIEEEVTREFPVTVCHLVLGIRF